MKQRYFLYSLVLAVLVAIEPFASAQSGAIGPVFLTSRAMLA